MNQVEIEKKLIQTLHSFPGRFNPYQVFFDWIRSMAYALSNTTDISPTHIEREDAYMKLVEKYGGEMNKFSECYGLLIQLFELEMNDWLGNIFMKGEFNNKNLGQFFTPYHLSKMMAALNLDEELLREQGKVKLYEPTVGAGGMVIAVADVMLTKGYNPQRQLEVYCTDLDENALLMAYIQLSILGLPAICEARNALAIENNPYNSRWITPGYYLFRRPGGTKPDRKTIKEDLKETESMTLEQMALDLF